MKELSLVPLGVLNTVLAQQNLPTTTNKNGSIKQVADLINSGVVTLDHVKAQKLTPTLTGLSNEVNDRVISAVNDAGVALHQAEVLRESVDKTLDAVFIQTTKLDKSFDELSTRLNAKVDAVETPDAKAIQSAVSVEVSKLFDSFRKSTPKAKIEEIAQSIPSITRKRVKDVFTGVLNYTSGGEVVDFSDFEIDVWSDPSAPALVDDYIFNPAHLHQALSALDSSLPDNVWLAGERGTGKTEFVTQLASRLGRRLYKVSFDEALERAEFIGGNTIENGNVVWKAGVVTQAIQHTGALVLLDEIGFARAQNIAVLHAVTEHSIHRALVISETGQRFPVASHVAFFCADNSNGHGDSTGNFAGVRDQNTAFIDRFSYTLRFDYLPFADEVALICKRTSLPLDATEILVKFANVAREKARAGLLTQPPSLRQLFAWARAIQKGIPIGVSFDSAIVNKFPADCESELRGIFSATIDVANLKSFLTGGK